MPSDQVKSHSLSMLKQCGLLYPSSLLPRQGLVEIYVHIFVLVPNRAHDRFISTRDSQVDLASHLKMVVLARTNTSHERFCMTTTTHTSEKVHEGQGGTFGKVTPQPEARYGE